MRLKPRQLYVCVGRAANRWRGQEVKEKDRPIIAENVTRARVATTSLVLSAGGAMECSTPTRIPGPRFQACSNRPSMPPATGRIAPLRWPASKSEERKTTAAAMSSGRATTCRGRVAMIRRRST